MEIGPNDGKAGRDHNSVGFVEIYRILALQDAIFIGTEPFARVKQPVSACVLSRRRLYHIDFKQIHQHGIEL